MNSCFVIVFVMMFAVHLLASLLLSKLTAKRVVLGGLSSTEAYNVIGSLLCAMVTAIVISMMSWLMVPMNIEDKLATTLKLVMLPLVMCTSSKNFLKLKTMPQWKSLSEIPWKNIVGAWGCAVIILICYVMIIGEILGTR